MSVLFLATAALALDPIVDGRAIGPLRQVANGFTSTFVLDVGDGTAALFDAGLDPSGSAVREALGYLGMTPADVTDVFLTHGHTDHTLGLRAFPGARVHAHVDELPLLAEAGTEVTLAHLDGDAVALGPYTIELLHLPGHTAGHSAYLVGGVLVLGDAVVVDEPGLAVIPRSFSDNHRQNIASLYDLATRLLPRRDSITHLAASHSGSTDDPDRLFRFVD